MELQLGKKYRAQDDDIYTVISIDVNFEYPCEVQREGCEPEWYMLDGRRYNDTFGSSRDLVEEVHD